MNQTKPFPDPSDGNDLYMTILAFLLFLIEQGILLKTILSKLPKKVLQQMGKKATKICKEKGIVPKKVPDEHYYQINSYPLSVLVEMWKGFDDLLI